MSWEAVTWQEVAVALIVFAAVGFLVWKIAGPTRRPRKPDVAARDLVRRHRD